MNVGPITLTTATTATDPVLVSLRGRVYGAVERQLREKEAAAVEAAGLLKRPLVKFGWSLLFELLAKIVAFVVEKMLDELSQQPPDVLMSLAVRRKAEVAARRASPTL